MALTSTTIFDIIGMTQTLTFNNPSQVDQIVFANNDITFETSSTYNLLKSDLILYFKYLNSFNNLLLINFPSINSSIGGIWPLSSFDITESSAGVTHIIYTQTSQGSTVLEINYVPIAGSASFITRSAPVTISLQEFFMTVLMMNQFINQVGLN